MICQDYRELQGKTGYSIRQALERLGEVVVVGKLATGDYQMLGSDIIVEYKRSVSELALACAEIIDEGCIRTNWSRFEAECRRAQAEGKRLVIVINSECDRAVYRNRYDVLRWTPFNAPNAWGMRAWESGVDGKVIVEKILYLMREYEVEAWFTASYRSSADAILTQLKKGLHYGQQ